MWGLEILDVDRVVEHRSEGHKNKNFEQEKKIMFKILLYDLQDIPKFT